MLIDLVVFGLIGVFSLLGITQGFVVSVLYLAAWFFGVLSAWLFSGACGILLSENIENLNVVFARFLGALLAFLVPFLLFRGAAILAKFVIKKSAPLSALNRVLGGIFGVLKGVVASVVILTVIHFLPTQGKLKLSMENSISYSIYKAVPFANLWKEFKPEVSNLEIP
jgi:membrane protein required for colicin V production